jgi:hypothetical protein
MANISNQRLDALRKREASVRSSIHAELERERKRKARLQARLVSIVGEALLREAEESTALRGVMRETLDATVTDESSRRLLSNLGWI